MKGLALNASARKGGNSATMLQHAVEGARSVGAEVDLIHLYDLDYKGCTGCEACKRLGGKSFGRCVQRDDLTPVLEQAIQADMLLLASPIYWSEVTGMLRMFQERLYFPTHTYTKEQIQLYPKRIRVGMIFTTNAPTAYYQPYYDSLKAISDRIIGETEYVAAENTWQFDDYAKYAADGFDVADKERQRREVFPQDCRNAWEMGRRLARQD